MTASDAGDTTYTDGKAYAYTTKLPLGVHSYYFHTTDTTRDAVSSVLQTGPAVSGTLLADDFEDGNADGWTPTSGTWTVLSGKYAGQAGSGNSFSMAGDAAWTDYTLQAAVSVTNNSGGNKDAGLLFRYADSNNYCVLYLKNNDRTGRKLELVKSIGGVKTTLGYANPSVAADTFYAYKIVASGANISVYQNGVLQFAVTDSSLASGRIGARVYANTKAFFDNVSVTR
ncbi:DUF1080 domain-containing protein [Cohnella ginsengisoli]|uniref:DUF1080 domain-containing protein n=1 Tax=Cohnella ginsengisoli TaxID=425004 RepID=A0A9X4KGQ3_9BACL|nr:family 16 glycoside hydrolase [Cohnella ginsengisoli]MDG0791621.1 DUF1080 domain-containing protein [Cohnella ginsengisoli]